MVRSIVDEGLKDWFESNPVAGKEWLKKILQMQKARNEAQLVEELARAGNKKNGELIDTTLSKKFLRCNTSDASRAETLPSLRATPLVEVLVRDASPIFRLCSNSRVSR